MYNWGFSLENLRVFGRSDGRKPHICNDVEILCNPRDAPEIRPQPQTCTEGEAESEVDAADWSHVIIVCLIPVWASKTSKRTHVRLFRLQISGRIYALPQESQRNLSGHVTEQWGHCCLTFTVCALHRPCKPKNFRISWLKRTKACWYRGRAACLPPRARVHARWYTRALVPVFIQFNPVGVYQRGGAARMVLVKTRSAWLSRHLFGWCAFVIGSQGEQRTHANICAFLCGWGASKPIPCESGRLQHQSPLIL